MKIPPEKELLDLLDKTEQEQKEWAIENCLVKVTGSTGGEDDKTVYESIPCLANRLWKLAKKCDLTIAMAVVSERIHKRVVLPSEVYADFACNHDQSIWFIIAAIIALGRSEVEL